MFCSSCGEKNSDTAKYCNACGALITKIETTHTLSVAVAESDENYLFDVELVDAGTNQLSVIKVLRNHTRLGLKETKDMVDKAPVIFEIGIEKSDAEKILNELSLAGAQATLKKGAYRVKDEIPYEIPKILKKNSVVISTKGELLIKLKEAMKVLAEADKIKLGVQNSVDSVQKIFNELSIARSHKAEIDRIAERQAEKFLGFDWFVIIIFTLIGSVIPVIGNIVMFVIGFILQALMISKFTFKKRRAAMPDKYKVKHREQFLKAEAEVEQLEKEHKKMTKVMTEKSESLQSYLYSDKYQDIGTYLAEKYICLGTVSWMVEALESQRADNLKEVINLYEDELHKGRLESMQKQQIAMQSDQLAATVKQLATAQETAEYARITADESEKATLLAQQTANNSAKAAKYAKKAAKSARFGNVINTANTVRHWNDGKKR